MYNETYPEIVECEKCGAKLRKEEAVIICHGSFAMSFLHRECCGNEKISRKYPDIVAVVKKADNKYTILHGEKSNRTMYPNKD